jgi:hypothetical protein
LTSHLESHVASHVDSEAGVLVHHHAPLHSLDALEQVEHLPLTHLAIPVRVALLNCVPNILLIIWGSHSHLQAEITIGIKELLSLELSAAVLVVLQVDLLYVLLQHLVVVVSPTSRVIDLVESSHLLVAAVVSPTVELMSVVSMVSMMALSLHSSLSSQVDEPSLLSSEPTWIA